MQKSCYVGPGIDRINIFSRKPDPDIYRFHINTRKVHTISNSKSFREIIWLQQWHFWHWADQA
eukprot:TRINITY_DN17258_c0_g1_i1.p1 TRINITY_DN17258_c0_g1~~TRINITY_DN17258_c0_g1_i1.p1  ORF type:complete len:63 (+),score=6.80 TRINITY_DN17258_c0_g1_i1:85-273(+)